MSENQPADGQHKFPGVPAGQREQQIPFAAAGTRVTSPALVTSRGSESEIALSHPKKPKRKLGRTSIAIIAVSVLAVAGWGVAIGAILMASSTGTALEASDTRIETIEAHKEKIEGELQKVTSDRNRYKDASDGVIARDGQVSAREAAVATREEAVTATEAYIEATTLEEGMTYTVGQTMEAGAYQTTSTTSRCYWKITASGTNYSDIVENDLGSVGVLTVSVTAGQDFTSSRCGSWTKVG